MITLRKLTLQRGIKVLLRDVDLMVHAGMRIGLVGANGCGKSSLFALMLGELHSETGDLDMQAGLTIAHVAQEVPSTIQAAIEYVTDGDTALRAIEAAIAAAEKSGDGERLALEHERYRTCGSQVSPGAREGSSYIGCGAIAVVIESFDV